MSVFAAVALVLAAVGMHGVTAYSVEQRTREIGVRVAVGASRSDILWMVIGGGMRQAAGGLIIGLGAATIVSRQLGSLLYGVSPLDWATITAAVAGGFALVACVANAAPALRAARINVVDALAER